MRYTASLSAILCCLFVNSASAEAPKPSFPLSPTEILEAAPATVWRDLEPENLMVMTLTGGKTVVIYLAPEFAPAHVGNIRLLAQTGWFSGSKIVRVQDNYVTQWGRTEEEAKLPAGIVKPTPAEYDSPGLGHGFKPIPYGDAYAKKVGFLHSWPVATDNKAHWLIHCYGMVAVGRDMAPDTGTGQELYTVIGHAPRHLDRNLAVVGRIISGMEFMTALPRGTGPLGFYEDPAQQTEIVKVGLVSDMAEADRPRYQILDTDTATFDQFVHARANRGGPFFNLAAGGVDVCNSMPPVRLKP